MSDHDTVVANQNLLDDQTHDALPFNDIERIGGTAQSSQEGREGFGQTQQSGPIIGLVGDRLQFGAQRLFPVAQRRHAIAQLFERYELFLIGVDHPFDALANTSQLPLDTLFALLCGIGGARRGKPAIEFLLDQRRVLQQSDDLVPDDLIEQILAHEAAIVAHRTAEFSPAVRANALVVMELPCTCARGDAREGVTALLATDQSLHLSLIHI